MLLSVNNSHVAILLQLQFNHDLLLLLKVILPRSQSPDHSFFKLSLRPSRMSKASPFNHHLPDGFFSFATFNDCICMISIMFNNITFMHTYNCRFSLSVHYQLVKLYTDIILIMHASCHKLIAFVITVPEYLCL